MEKELIKQKNHTNIEQRKTFWIGIIALSGGIATLSISIDSYIKFGLLIIGILAFSFFAIGIKITNQNLVYLFNQMEKKE